MTTPKNVLEKNGPLLSSELARKISIANSLEINTASQIVTRDKSIMKIKGFFVSNQSLCYLDIHIKDNLLFDCLINCLFENGKKYWYCLNAIRLHEGVISQKYLQCYTNYPILPLKSHIPFEKVMQSFISQNILIFNEGYYMFSPNILQGKNISFSYKAVEMIKDNILDHFGSLAKNIGLVSYKTGENFAEHGKFLWAYKGVSAITGLKQNNDNGFLLADILIGKRITEKDVDFFLKKIKHIQSFKNSSRLIPFLIVDSLNKNALQTLKESGIVVGFIGELFGQKYAETLKELISILNNAGASLKKSPEKYLELIKQLKKYNEGLANNIKGTLFEFLVGHIHSINSESIDLGWEIYENHARHDIDILAIYPNKIVFSECKAIKSKIGIEVIDEWIGKKIPAFKKWFDKQEVWKKKIVEFEFWSTSGFTDESLKKLNDLSLNSTRYKISYYQAEEIKNKAKEIKNKKMKEAIDNFFLKNPV